MDRLDKDRVRNPLMASSYPVNLTVSARPVLVVGGGPVAARKVAGLLRAGAEVTVVAPEAVPEISEDPAVRWFARPYQRGEVASYRLAFTATGHTEVDRQVATDGDRSGIWVNSADDPDNCTFTLPAVASQGDLNIAISTSGRSPALAGWLCRRYQREISVGYEETLELLADLRRQVRNEFGSSESAGWSAALDAGLIDLVRSDQADDARALLRHHLGLTDITKVAVK